MAVFDFSTSSIGCVTLVPIEDSQTLLDVFGSDGFDSDLGSEESDVATARIVGADGGFVTFENGTTFTCSSDAIHELMRLETPFASVSWRESLISIIAKDGQSSIAELTSDDLLANGRESAGWPDLHRVHRDEWLDECIAAAQQFAGVLLHEADLNELFSPTSDTLFSPASADLGVGSGAAGVSGTRREAIIGEFDDDVRLVDSILALASGEQRQFAVWAASLAATRAGLASDPLIAQTLAAASPEGPSKISVQERSKLRRIKSKMLSEAQLDTASSRSRSAAGQSHAIDALIAACTLDSDVDAAVMAAASSRWSYGLETSEWRVLAVSQLTSYPTNR